MFRTTVLIVTVVFCCFGDTLHFRDGKSVAGTWLGSSTDSVRFLVDNQVQEFHRADIQQVVFGDGSSAPPPSAVSSGTAVPSTPPRPAQASQLEQTIAGMHLIAQKCERVGTQALQCFATAEALDKDGLLCVDGYAIDSKGIKKTPTGVTIGGASGGQYAGTNIVQNVPVSIVLKFPGVDPDVTGIPRLILGLYSGCQGKNLGTSEFRNVPLSAN